MNFRSALYVGSVMHRRSEPRVHKFRYRAFWLLADLDELAELSGSLRLFSHNRPNLFSLYEADHGDGTATPLRAQLESKLNAAGIDHGGGPIRLLCMPRSLGYCFNPLSVYFCYHPDGTLVALVYQVHNTFGDRHSYVLAAERDGAALQQQCRKSFYVSPFMDMGLRYDFRVTGPGERVSVGIRATDSTLPILNAVLTGERRDLTDRNLIGVFLKIPAVTLKVIVAIHWEAVRLWSKGLAFHRPPVRSRASPVVSRVTPSARD